MTGSPLKLIIEAFLFASDKPLGIREIQAWLPGETPSSITHALKELQTEYETMERSFIVREVAKGYQFRTKSKYSAHILKMFQTSPPRLSRASLETLAIIAYKQPVLRHEIESLRGVDVGGILKTLLEKNLIRIMGRKSLPGRPLVYGTTQKFLEVFDLKDVESLPKLKEIRKFGPDEEQIVSAGETTEEERSGCKEGEAAESGVPEDTKLSRGFHPHPSVEGDQP